MESLNLDSLLENLAPESEFDGVVNGDTLKESRKQVKEDDGSRVYRNLTVYDILPKIGTHLGLDISKSSTGVTIVRDGIIDSFNLSLKGTPDEMFSEILLRREFKELLSQQLEGTHFNTILIEDAYEGVNPSTTRLLYSLNTVIDELILDDDIKCNTFIRVNNKSWKSWLWSIEPQIGKGLDEKTRIEEVLKYLGVSDSGSGYQDRLDSLGMLVGYFFKEIKNDLNSFKLPKVNWSSVDYTLVKDLSLLVEVPEPYNSLPISLVDVGNKLLTRDYIKYLVSANSGKLVVVNTSRSLELVKNNLGIPRYLDGTLVLWRK